jgi:hypothetical protein
VCVCACVRACVRVISFIFCIFFIWYLHGICYTFTGWLNSGYRYNHDRGKSLSTCISNNHGHLKEMCGYLQIKILMTISSRCFNHHVITVHVVVHTKSLKISKYEIGLMSYGIYIYIYNSNIYLITIRHSLDFLGLNLTASGIGLHQRLHWNRPISDDSTISRNYMTFHRSMVAALVFDHLTSKSVLRHSIE